jgi:arylsulfatase A
MSYVINEEASTEDSSSMPRILLPLTISLAIACISYFADSAYAFERPNIIMVLADDVGLGDIASFNPESKVSLPTLEKLAAEGIRFTDAHTSASQCAPSRYSIITGNYQWRGRRAWGSWEYKGGSQILPGQKTLGDVLSAAGYATAIIGKYHLGGDFFLKGSNAFALGQTPDDQIDFSRPMFWGASEHGFDYSFLALRGLQGSPYAFFENDRLLGSAQDLIQWEAGDYGDTEILISGIGLPDWNTREVGPILLSKALEFIDDHQSGRSAESPFFIYFNTQAVHVPLKPPRRLGGRQILGSTGLGARTDMLVELDVVVEQLLESLKRHGIADDTIVIFTSDNGGNRPANELRAGHDSSAGLRGSKGNIYEGGHRVPLIIKWGDKGFRGSTLNAGSEIDGLVGAQDLFATLAELVGVELQEDQGRDSVSILPLLLGSTDRSPRDHMIHEATKAENWEPQHAYAYRFGDWKLLLDDQDRPFELYDLSQDIEEQSNLVDSPSHASLVGDLTADFRAARAAERTTPPLDLTAAPSNLEAKAASASRITLRWKDNSDKESGFRVDRKVGSGKWVRIAKVRSNVTRFSDTGLEPSKNYRYRVRALNPDRNSAYSNVAKAKTKKP